VLLTGLTGAEALWDLPQVNVLVSSLLSRVVVVSGLVRFGAQKVKFVILGLPGLDRSDRRATPT
jgi:hypothetical protein